MALGEGCYVIPTHTTHINYCVPNNYSHQNEHGERKSGDFESNKDNLMIFLTPMAQQPCDQPNKVVSPKNKGAKQKSCMMPPHHLLVNKGEKINVKSCGGPHWKWDFTSIPLKPSPPTLTLTNNVPHCNIYVRDVDHCFTLYLKL